MTRELIKEMAKRMIVSYSLIEKVIETRSWGIELSYDDAVKHMHKLICHAV